MPGATIHLRKSLLNIQTLLFILKYAACPVLEILCNDNWVYRGSTFFADAAVMPSHEIAPCMSMPLVNAAVKGQH